MSNAMQNEDPVRGQPHPSEIALSGEIDAKSAGEFASLVFADPTWPTLQKIDCSRVTFFSAAGLSLLLRIANQRPIAIVASPAVRRVIGICGLSEVLVVVN